MLLLGRLPQCQSFRRLHGYSMALCVPGLCRAPSSQAQGMDGRLFPSHLQPCNLLKICLRTKRVMQGCRIKVECEQEESCPLKSQDSLQGAVVPYNTLEGRYSSGGGRSESGVRDEEAPSASAPTPAKRRLFSGPAALPEGAPKTCEASSKLRNRTFIKHLVFQLKKTLYNVS